MYEFNKTTNCIESTRKQARTPANASSSSYNNNFEYGGASWRRPPSAEHTHTVQFMITQHPFGRVQHANKRNRNQSCCCAAVGRFGFLNWCTNVNLNWREYVCGKVYYAKSTHNYLTNKKNIRQFNLVPRRLILTIGIVVWLVGWFFHSVARSLILFFFFLILSFSANSFHSLSVAFWRI